MPRIHKKTPPQQCQDPNCNEIHEKEKEVSKCLYGGNRKKLCNKECTVCFDKSFASSTKADFWDYASNGEVKPRNVSKNSHKKLYFKCNDCDHLFCTSLGNISNGAWCPYCSKPPKELCDDTNCKKCHEKSFASNDKEVYWYQENNGDETPRKVFKSSDKKYWFKCNDCECDHIFSSRLFDITNGRWCPYCSTPAKQLCEDMNCTKCYEKSFASNEKAVYWCQENNEDMTPRKVFKSSGNRYWFKCNECDHIFWSGLNHITNGNWCPYCSTPPKELCDDTNCKKCYEKSFASNEKAVYWCQQNNEDMTPRKVFKSSRNKYWFKCNDCDHTFCSCLYNITNGVWCPYCSSNELCDDTNCKKCYEKSFASNEKAVYWYQEKNGDQTPRDVLKSSNKKYWFKCNDCDHTFCSSLNNITNGVWCPLCKNKTEKLVYQTLLSNGYEAIHQAKFEWCKSKENGKYLPFDICIETKKIIIEIDGPQHFMQVSNWASHDKNRNADTYKTKCAEENSYKVIRIVQEDILNKNFDWYETLRSHIEELEREHCFISICDNIYDEHIAELENQQVVYI
jgi:very-short-patch-repair endonuclease/DNA-directed RNA polymerase subunit L